MKCKTVRFWNTTREKTTIKDDRIQWKKHQKQQNSGIQLI